MTVLGRLWRKNRDRWTAEHPWLGAAHSDGMFGLGCFACYAAGNAGRLARFQYIRWPMQKSLFYQHARTPMHCLAMGTATARAVAPSADDFQRVLRGVKGRALSRPMPRVGGTKKLRRMSYCIAEALRRQDRAFMARATHITLIQDVRKSRLLARFRPSAPGIGVRSGILGQERMNEGGTLNLRDATVRILENCCTSFANAPMTKVKADLDGDLALRMTRDVRFYTGDAAGDEQAAGDPSS